MFCYSVWLWLSRFNKFCLIVVIIVSHNIRCPEAKVFELMFKIAHTCIELAV